MSCSLAKFKIILSYLALFQWSTLQKVNMTVYLSRTDKQIKYTTKPYILKTQQKHSIGVIQIESMDHHVRNPPVQTEWVWTSNSQSLLDWWMQWTWQKTCNTRPVQTVPEDVSCWEFKQCNAAFTNHSHYTTKCLLPRHSHTIHRNHTETGRLACARMVKCSSHCEKNEERRINNRRRKEQVNPFPLFLNIKYKTVCG